MLKIKPATKPSIEPATNYSIGGKPIPEVVESAEQEVSGETSAVEETPKQGRSRRKRKSKHKALPQLAEANEGPGADVVEAAEQEVGGEESVVIDERAKQEGHSRRKRKSGRKSVLKSAKANRDPGAGIVESAGNGEVRITRAYAEEFLECVTE